MSRTDPHDPAGTQAPLRRVRRLVRAALVLVVAALVSVLAGFALFVASLQGREAQPTRSADGIVVLTGGAERIPDATILLAQHRGQRLLITGVHPSTTLTEIGRAAQVPDDVLKCCVELGRSALNTRGNAIETAQWARERGFHSLLVVTSSWHMPRALVELRRAMPDIELVPFPVVAREDEEKGLRSTLASARLLFGEYVKFVGTWLGVRSWPALAPQSGISRS
ncbi:YdcF family protein [Ancylobacter mangrovi]|uniref:YdcF family protein n=1 Tax=Ancylobacter mangrovi TaxID=2972472 RepID=A0A9X2T1X6_9HYPH|nr:YdcF family protein [Ancylobacter mangrovi]MCS0495232.1 YdcF family protein [Ancylobacter mangrovi]MCS0502627.1 YdcF family protein [Ancylobacter mangrovi]